MDNKMKLTIEIKNKQPIELIDLAQSMLGIGGEYQNYLARHAIHMDADEAKLYVKEVRSGSVITELVALAPYALPLVEHADTILGYGNFLGKAFDWLIGRGDRPAEILGKPTLQNLNEIIEPVAKDRGAQFNLSGVTINGDVNVTFSINSTEANAAQNSIRRELQAMQEPVTGIHNQVVLYWAQARNKSSSKAGDRAVIESIYKGDIKVRFASDDIKVKMLFDEPHPFQKAFIVDVAVETVNDKPILYKVLEYHEAIEA